MVVPFDHGARRDGAQTLGRGLRIASLIMQAGQGGLGLSDVVEATGLNKSTTHRLLLELVGAGLLSRDEQRRYRLGPLAYEMGLVSSYRYDVRPLCETSLDRIACSTGDTVFLGKRCGASSVCIDHRIGAEVRPPIVPPKGRVHPLGVGSMGMAVLSQLSDEQVTVINAANRKRLEAFAGVSSAYVQEMVERTRALGFARMANHVAHGVVSLGVSINDGSGRPLLAISVATTLGRMSRSHEQSVLDALYAEALVLQESLLQRSRFPADAFAVPVTP
ncbi:MULTISPECIES: IclR family transcriptional regulator [Comamonadaceae]|uniref:IclR family transcriptional regulator n=4 Tax=cellular organisms TaxID=131567 RepID=A0A420RLH5_GIBIN|nr:MULTISPECIES: IclR family transcriptional regulator [Comamonadaceae]MDR7092897.1 DNA-binding IclR family transcriptional regulator [Hydrogenophaga laconesensis]RKL17874.1 hypothetical protein BFJ72_g15253 [Fusarium proliferatum]GAO20852.1 transcriptional regulator, IclR family [Alicycliphilus sp. B1]SFE86562.1 DNA-binding transcriptional regulator, IclR family [Paracidovorax wautersii]